MNSEDDRILRAHRTKAQAKESYDKISRFYDYFTWAFERKYRNMAIEAAINAVTAWKNEQTYIKDQQIDAVDRASWGVTSDPDHENVQEYANGIEKHKPLINSAAMAILELLEGARE